MLKFLLILFLVGYVFYKVSGFLFRMLFYKAYQQQSQQSARAGGQRTQAQGYAKRPADGNVQIDHIPPPNDKSKSKADFNGGDYVEYEEVE